MSEIYYNEFDDFPVIETTTGIIEQFRDVVETCCAPSVYDIKKPTYLERFDYILEFGYVVPSRELIDEIKSLDQQWVSVGSGLGFVEYLLIRNGVDIIATDVEYPIENPYFRRNGYCDIQKIESCDAIKLYDRNVFISWPCMDKTWAYECIRSMSSGKKLIYVGEDINGCTADIAFHVYLSRNFQFIRDFPHKRFHGIEDRISLYIKL